MNVLATLAMSMPAVVTTKALLLVSVEMVLLEMDLLVQVNVLTDCVALIIVTY
jgi:hypothetical protein